MSDKVLLTDVDGVLLDYLTPFSHFMGRPSLTHDHYDLGKCYDIKDIMPFIEAFNQSDRIRSLRPYKDAQEGISAFLDMGYQIIAITALGTDPAGHAMRIENLQSVFGKDAFKRFHFTGMTGDKMDILNQYRDSGYLWIEDKVKNAEDGLECGLRSVLMEYTHSKEYSHSKIPKVQSWAEIVAMVA